IFVAAILWDGVVTQTAGSVEATARTTASQLFSGSAIRSSDLGYSVLGGQTVSPAARLGRYREHAFKVTHRPLGAVTPYFPRSLVSRYPTPIVDEPPLRDTGVGEALDGLGISPSTF